MALVGMARIAQGPRSTTSTMHPVQVVGDRFAVVAIFLFVLGVALPKGLTVDADGFLLSPIKIVLLMLLVPAAVRALKTRNLRLQSFDILLLMGLAWLLVALSVNNGVERALTYGGSQWIEAMGAYLVARAYVRSSAQFASAVRIYLLFVLIAAVCALPEFAYNTRVLAFLDAPIDQSLHLISDRLGLTRAASTFDHPILYGAFCATSFTLAWYLYYDRPVRWIIAAGIAIATFFSVSSAPLLGCALGAACVAWEMWTRQLPNRAAITLSLVAAAWMSIELFSNRSAANALSNLVALDSWTAYYRLLIWQYATANIAEHPWVGVGLNDWARPDWMVSPTVDSFWLHSALTGGLPMVAFLGVGVILLLVRVNARSLMPETSERWQARLGWSFAVLGLCLQAFTVHYWGAMHAFFFFLLGLGAWMTDSGDGLERPAEVPADTARSPTWARGRVLRPALRAG
jgi:hypothetical protein